MRRVRKRKRSTVTPEFLFYVIGWTLVTFKETLREGNHNFCLGQKAGCVVASWLRVWHLESGSLGSSPLCHTSDAMSGKSFNLCISCLNGEGGK